MIRGSVSHQSFLKFLPPGQDILLLGVDVIDGIVRTGHQLVGVGRQRLDLLLLVADGFVEVFVLR